MAAAPRTPVVQYRRENARGRSVSQHLVMHGNQPYEVGEQSGYEVYEIAKDPMVAIVGYRRLPDSLTTYIGMDRRASREQLIDEQAEVLRKIWNDLVQEEYFVAWAWTANGMMDTTRIVVSGYPIETGYTTSIAPHPQQPVEGPGSALEVPGTPEPVQAAKSPEPVTQDDLENDVANLLLEYGKRPFTEGHPGFEMLPWEGPHTAVLVKHRIRTTAVGATDMTNDELGTAMAAPGHYYTALHEHYPTWLLGQESDLEVLVVGSTWQHVLMVVVELKQHEWQMQSSLDEHPGDADSNLDDFPLAAGDTTGTWTPEADSSGISLEAWKVVAGMFISPEQAATAVEEIKRAHQLAQDGGASGMERRLHDQVIQAIAAGSPYAVTLAELAMQTNHLYFHRA